MLDESLLIERAKRGSASAYEDLVRVNEQIAFRVAYLILGDSSKAQDAAQEGFIKAYLALDKFDSTRQFRPWLLRIVTNEALNAVKSTKRRNDVEQRYVEEKSVSHRPAAVPDEIAMDREANHLLIRTIAELKDSDRIAIYMRYFLGLTETEMADALDCKIGTVRSRVSRALTRLREIVLERSQQEEDLSAEQELTRQKRAF